MGELLIDFTPLGEETGVSGQASYKGLEALPRFIQNPGGAPANLLVAAGKLGVDVSFIGKVGKDAFGDFLEKTLIDHKVDTKGLVRSEEVLTTLAFVHLLKNGERSFTFYRNPGADMTITRDEVDMSLIKKARVFHFGSLSLTHDAPKDAAFLAVETAKKAGCLISFDPNHRPLLWKNIDSFRSAVLPFLSVVNVLKVSEEEAFMLSGQKNNLELSARALSSLGPGLVLITLGDKGAYYLSPQGQTGMIQAPKINPIDTTGAGDAFLGTFLAELVKRDALLSTPNSDEVWKEIVALSVCAGSLTCLKKGAIAAIPSYEETRKAAEELLRGV
jgi:fructokinase